MFTAVTPERHLLVLEIEGILWAAPPHGSTGTPVPRPYLKTFLDYLLHPGTPYRTAIWTRIPKSQAIRNILRLGLDIFSLEASTVVDAALVAFWGCEESGVSSERYLGGAEHGPKDLEVTPQPFSVLPAPPYMLPGDKSDTFLLELVGLLETLADSENFSRAIKRMHLDSGIPDDMAESFIAKAKAVCDDRAIDVVRGKGTVNSDYIRTVALDVPAPHDEGLEPIDDRSLKLLECIFCEKKLKATFKIIQQNDDFIAFFSHNPSSPIHVLCIPRFHVRDCTLLREKDLPWLKALEAYGLDAYRKSCKAMKISGDHPYRHGLHVPPSTTVQHLHMHITALPTPSLASLFTVAEKAHLDAHHTPSIVHPKSATYSNRLENLVGDGEVQLAIAGAGALYILASDLFSLLEEGMRVEARGLRSEYRGDEVEIGVTKVLA